MSKKGDYSNQRNNFDLDCCVCRERFSCDRWAEGTFCDRFASRNFESKRDPLKIWEESRKKYFDDIRKRQSDQKR